MTAAREWTGGGVTNWGRWGADDERGALNVLDPDTVLAAVRGCATGKVYNLGVPIRRHDMPNVEYRGAPQRYTLVNSSDEAMYAPMGAAPGTGANEDVLVIPSHTATHIDSLSHVYSERSLYNGHPHDSMSAYNGAARCGIDKAGGFAARGVLVDVASNLGVDWLDPGHVITGEEFAGAVVAQGTEVRRGDVVIVRTGWLEYFYASGGDVDMNTQPGIGFEVVDWLGDKDIVAIGADNTAVEALPFDRGAFLGVHIECLVKRGIYLIEHVRTAELRADSCYEFLFVIGPLLVTGATASPVNPIAIG
jgi:kynurenine formamidase